MARTKGIAQGLPPIGLLGAKDSAPVRVVNAAGASPFLIIGDHAGNAIPRSLGTLGLGGEDRARHIAWDIGVMALGERLASRLDAPFIAQPYSRLVIDCNRDPASPESIVSLSDGSPVPANAMLHTGEREARIAEIHRPYHDAIAEILAEREAKGRETILIALHSFTPVMAGEERPWQIGVLHGRGNAGFARSLLNALKTYPYVKVGDNAPYRMDDTDFSIPRHAFAARLPYAEIEVRQDLIADEEGLVRWCRLLGGALEGAAAS